MKRNFVYIVLSLALALSLCGCGDAMVDNEVTATKAPVVTNTPMATPRVEDGIVDDNDGIIVNNDGAGTNRDDKPMIDIDETEGAEVNTQPTNSAKPTATTKPSATVNP